MHEVVGPGTQKKQGKLFPTNCKTDHSKPCGMFFSKNCLFSRTHVVSLVVAEYLFLLVYSIVALSRLNKLFDL